MKGKRAIVWFRHDLRLHDNEALCEALKHAEEVVPVYVFDERTFMGKTTHFDFPKTGKYRAQFTIEAVEDLRDSLRKLGSDLYVCVGKPEDILSEMCAELKCSWVFCNREPTSEEAQVQDRLEQKLWAIGQEIRYLRGKMLYYTQDLPFPVAHTPDVFSQFRKETERITKVRPPLPKPVAIVPLSVRVPVGAIPTIQDFGHADIEPEPRSAMAFKGGETAALQRLRYYLWDSDFAKTYEETRNGMIGSDYSSKFSAFLALGCLSPKMIYKELQRYEAERGGNKSTYWLFFELLWRDFFRLMGKKYGNRIFQIGGTVNKPDKRWQENPSLFQAWADGNTGVPFIDANMRELQCTGFMSNRGRQNVASFLVKDLHLNWLMGAELMESLLIDYDPCSNYGNWNYVAGVGSDPRENRYFNILTQAYRYDPKGEYVKLWCPELQALPAEKIHRPDALSFAEQTTFAVKIGGNYPKAIVSTAKWTTR